MSKTQSIVQRTFFAALAVLLLFASPAVGQEIAISNIEGPYAPGKVSPGETITVTFAIDNSGATGNVKQVSLGWEIDSPDGAAWDTVIVREPASFAFYDYFDLFRVQEWYSPPTGQDTVVVFYSVLFGDGIPVDSSVEFFEVEFGPISGPLGATIVLDSVASFDPAEVWRFLVDPPGSAYYPAFEALTFEIAECCQGTVGNVDGSRDDLVTLTDITTPVNALFITFEELPCPKEANCSGDPEGLINLTDVSVLITSVFVTFEPLPACQ